MVCFLSFTICIIQVTFLAVSAYRCSPVRDEFGHFYAGLQYWKYQDIETFNVNPPLIRALGTLPAFMLWKDVPVIDRNHEAADSDIELYVSTHVVRTRHEFDDGHRLYAKHPGQFRHHLFLGRLLVSMFTLLGTLTLLYWGTICFGKSGGLAAATIWAFQPQIIAHGSLITNDVPVAAGMLLACCGFAAWCRQPSWTKSLCGGLFLGIATSCKFTALLLWPVFLLFTVFVIAKNWQHAFMLILQSSLAVVVALLTVAVPYRFADVGKPLGEIRFLSDQVVGTAWDETQPRYQDRWFARVPSPVPMEFIVGMDRQQFDFDMGLSGYAAGTLSQHGWWWFYIYAMLVKLPSGTWLAMIASLVCVYMQNNRTLSVIATVDVALAAVMAFAMLQITAYKSGFAQQHRYILPLYPFIFFLTGSIFRWIGQASLYGKLVWGGVGLTVLSCIAVAPHWLGFFNLPSGGSRYGYKHLFNDATDWGQDCYLVRQWLEDHPEIRPVNIISVNGFLYQTPESMRLPENVTISQQQERWTVVSKHDLVITRGAAYRDHEPSFEIGSSHFVYENK
ncbi:Dolichyl-phosphate-mannose-protein mannosyltransferase [Rubripirellula amarantea]|uniref:Dolichyl-phosphate-mannose-protein mannosyltransferase n=1 Tax=Rubripirellula amarantea TaxID=2527999 RepID=A0A5C5WRV1_9BACT|nr:glycosyltransferase family 39 protein [Rubripirellula amarantea]TWT52905.1 Dolichyl-phosphate-mannose-protein mannosyltransferase [Rubripirellula amarantea]